MISKLLAAAICLGMMTATAGAREVVDMTGRKVTIPDNLTKVFAPSPYGAYMMYAIAPDLMTGVMSIPNAGDKKFLPKSLWNLPVLGTGMMMGGGPMSNPEMFLKTGTQLLVIWRAEAVPLDAKALSVYDKLGIPYVIVSATTLYEYPEAIRYLGRLFYREKRAELMARLATRILADADAVPMKVPVEQRPKVYYAEGLDGLSTECNDSIHVQVMKIAGDVNVHRCHTASHVGMEKISIEQVMMYNPDVIVAQEKMFTQKVYGDPAWAQVKAVRNHRVFLIPRDPLNWFDRPPSFMRFLGLVWLTNKLYPQQYPVNMVKETQQFYSTFLGAQLTGKDVQEVLGQ